MGPATIRFANKTVVTDSRGAATIVQRFTRARTHQARACKSGFRCGTTRVAVLPARSGCAGKGGTPGSRAGGGGGGCRRG
jgi:ferredoxin